MNAKGLKKVVDFVVMRPALSSRNFTSIVLVVVFAVVYVASGGKISPPPKVKQGGSFGSINAGQNARASQQMAPAAVPAQNQVQQRPRTASNPAQRNLGSGNGQLFSQPPRQQQRQPQMQQQRVPPQGMQPQARPPVRQQPAARPYGNPAQQRAPIAQNPETSRQDSLAAIEQRLNIRRRASGQ